MEDHVNGLDPNYFCPSGTKHEWVDNGKFYRSMYEPTLESGTQTCRWCQTTRHVMREYSNVLHMPNSKTGGYQ